MNEPKLVTLYRDTLTLKWPTLEDFLKLYWEAKPLTIVDMNYYKVSGRLPGAKGLDIKLVKSCRATYDKILVFDRPDVKVCRSKDHACKHSHMYAKAMSGPNNFAFHVCTTHR